MKRNTIIALGAIAGLAVSTAAHADRIDMFVFENADGVDTSGLDIWVDAVDGGTHIDLVFHNDSEADSFVTSLYIEATEFTSEGFEDMMILTPQPVGVDYESGAHPQDPAGSIDNYMTPWRGSLFSASPESPSPVNGINPGESLTIRAEYDGINFSDVMNNLNSSDGFRIAQHIQGIGEGSSSVWAVNEPVPEPAAAAAIVLMALAPRRRR